MTLKKFRPPPWRMGRGGQSLGSTQFLRLDLGGSENARKRLRAKLGTQAIREGAKCSRRLLSEGPRVTV